METPKVSIIIPIYNSMPYLRDCIESALNQTWKNCEIIVVDDGSTDNSLVVAKEYENQGIIVISRTNAGASAARNTAMKYATGRYIQFLDADDILDSKKIEYQMDLLLQNPINKIASCPWGKFKYATSEADFITQQVWGDFSPVDWLITAWNGGGMMQTACWLTPIELINKAGNWNESLIHNPADDGEFFCRVLLHSDGIKFCDKSKVYYRTDIKNSLSKQLRPESVFALYKNCELYESHILKYEKSERVKQACVTNYKNFIYRFYPAYPDLISLAFKNIKHLDVKKHIPVGGKTFKLIAHFIGFNNALKLRSLIQKNRTL